MRILLSHCFYYEKKLQVDYKLGNCVVVFIDISFKIYKVCYKVV